MNDLFLVEERDCEFVNSVVVGPVGTLDPHKKIDDELGNMSISGDDGLMRTVSHIDFDVASALIVRTLDKGRHDFRLTTNYNAD